MRMSCNGCRVLRKGCSEGCTIRPCLEWIKSPEAQANATVFLAKFYGRAGLLNLLAAGPDNLRPALFRSLLYEACGRMVNPIYGSVGLLWSGQWQACQAGVEAVLKGDRIVQVSSEAATAAQATPPLRAYDIRHIAKDPAAADRLRVAHAGRTRFKRASSSTSKSKGPGARHASPTPRQEPEQEPVVVGDHDDHDEESAGSHDHGHVEDEGMALQETREESEDTEDEAGSHVSQAEQSSVVTMRQVVVVEDKGTGAEAAGEEIGLELTLGFEPVTRVVSLPRARFDVSGLSAESSHIGLQLELPA